MQHFIGMGQRDDACIRYARIATGWVEGADANVAFRCFASRVQASTLRFIEETSGSGDLT